jgi:hypothetical protein
MYWQDRMDESRVVKPQGDLPVKGSVLCSIYWKSGKGTLIFGGKAKVPVNLFGNERLGFSQVES